MNVQEPFIDIFLQEEQKEIKAYLYDLYTEIFPPESITAHYINYVGAASVEWPLAVLGQFVPPGSSVQDIGCGFGSFVLSAREAGYDARGIELSEKEVAWARLRLSRLRSTDKPLQVYRQGDAHTALQQGYLFGGSVDAVTLWNVAEHIPNFQELIAECVQALKPGGWLFWAVAVATSFSGDTAAMNCNAVNICPCPCNVFPIGSAVGFPAESRGVFMS